MLKVTASNGYLPYLVAKVMRGSAEAEYASVKDRNSVTVLDSDTIIICDGSNSGEVFTGFNGILSSTMGKIVKKTEIDDNFLRAFLASTFEVFNGAKTGAAIPHLDKNAMFALELPLPPVSEQQRIVGILEKAFEGIATSKANAEKNLQNARALFESHLQSVFSQRGEGWVERPLVDCLQLITYGFTNPMPTTNTGPYMVTAKNVVGGQIDYVSTRHTSRDAFEKLLTDKSRPKVGDVLLTKDGTLGRLAVVDRQDICINQSVALLRPNERMEPHFMKYLLSSPCYQQRMVANAGGTTIKHIYITRVDKMEVVFPILLSEQQRIVSILDDFMTETQHLASIYERKLASLEALKNSLLHDAFRGAL